MRKQRKHQTRQTRGQYSERPMKSFGGRDVGGNNQMWINERTGESYSGPVHYHDGKVMVGATHTSQPHDYLRPGRLGGGVTPPTIERKRARKRRKVKRKPRRGRDNL